MVITWRGRRNGRPEITLQKLDNYTIKTKGKGNNQKHDLYLVGTLSDLAPIMFICDFLKYI